MATRLPTAVKNSMVAGGFPTTTTFYWGFNTTTPGTTGAHEVSGGSYVRKVSKVTAASTAKVHTASAMTFTGMPSCTVKYFSIWSASTGGTYKGGGATSTTITVPSGSTLACAIGAFTLAQAG